MFLQCRFLILRNPINILHNKVHRKIHASTQFVLDNTSHVYTDLQIFYIKSRYLSASSLPNIRRCLLKISSSTFLNYLLYSCRSLFSIMRNIIDISILHTISHTKSLNFPLVFFFQELNHKNLHIYTLIMWLIAILDCTF